MKRSRAAAASGVPGFGFREHDVIAITTAMQVGSPPVERGSMTHSFSRITILERKVIASTSAKPDSEIMLGLTRGPHN
jgi:hypothetical protein